MAKLYVVGIGPGKYEGMTFEASDAIKESSLVVGYTKYVELVKPHYPEKEYYDTGMRQEMERVRAALEQARKQIVALVCSGDSGVYGLAGLAYELLPEYPGVEISVIPGVTSALSGSALLGAALGHDFAVISLSDLLTPWELIEKRLEMAAKGDFCMAIYNPSSKTRHDYLQKACDILLAHISGETACGVAKNIGRTGESTEVMTLSELRNYSSADMFTTVFVGNSQTRIQVGKLVTPRGYHNKESK